MTDEQLEQHGFLLCETGDTCEKCNQVTPQADYFWISTSYEYPQEGDYYCRGCAVKAIEEDRQFNERFEAWVNERRAAGDSMFANDAVADPAGREENDNGVSD